MDAQKRSQPVRSVSTPKPTAAPTTLAVSPSARVARFTGLANWTHSSLGSAVLAAAAANMPGVILDNRRIAASAIPPSRVHARNFMQHWQAINRHSLCADRMLCRTSGVFSAAAVARLGSKVGQLTAAASSDDPKKIVAVATAFSPITAYMRVLQTLCSNGLPEDAAGKREKPTLRRALSVMQSRNGISMVSAHWARFVPSHILMVAACYGVFPAVRPDPEKIPMQARVPYRHILVANFPAIAFCTVLSSVLAAPGELASFKLTTQSPVAKSPAAAAATMRRFHVLQLGSTLRVATSFARMYPSYCSLFMLETLLKDAVTNTVGLTVIEVERYKRRQAMQDGLDNHHAVVSGCARAAVAPRTLAWKNHMTEDEIDRLAGQMHTFGG